jgi:hypothetical protein
MNQPVRRTTLQELDESDGLQGLTSKQYRFAIACFSGLSDADAYRQAYECRGMTDAAIYSASAQLSRHPLVRAKLQELRVKLDGQTSLAPGLNREFVLNGIMGLAITAQKDSTRLAAYIALGKTVGIDLFREVHVTEKITRTVDDVDKELREHLTRLQSTIDATAKDVTPAPAASVKPAGGRDRRRKPIA